MKGAEKSTKSVKTKTSTTSLPPTPLSVPSDDAQLIRSALAAAKAENEALRRASELRVLQPELSSVQQQNARLQGELEDPPLPSTLTVPSSVPPPLTTSLSSPGGGGTPLYKVYRYVPPQRVWFLSRFGLKTGIDFDNYGLKSGRVFGAGNIYESLPPYFSSQYVTGTTN